MENWNTVIQPRDKFFDLGLGEVWQKKYLLWLFIKRDISVKFKQTIFGFAWYVISPLFSTLIYIVIFGKIAGIPTDQVPQPLFYLAGVCLWNYFSQCLTKVASTFQTESGIFGKVYFPRLISPLSYLFSFLVKFIVQLLTLVIMYVVYAVNGLGVHPNWALCLFPLQVTLLAMIALGLGLIVTSLTTKYRDLKNIFGVLVSLWMYATPIVYPMSVIENPALRTAMRLNPLSSIVESFRYGLFGAGEFSWPDLGYSAVCAAVLCLVGMWLFKRKEKLFIDTI